MNKPELIVKISNDTGKTKKDVSVFLDEILSSIKEVLISGEDVSIHEFGKFEIRKVKERYGINPATKESIVIPSYNKIAFKASKALKDNINNKS